MAKIIDVHSHFLPGIDDGCKKIKDSIALLIMSSEQGVDTICGTPHYYSTCSVQEFLNKREYAMSSLMDAIMKVQHELVKEGEATLNLPKMRMGAEVAYTPYLINEDRIADLCYEGTNYLLLEMPFESWGPKVIQDVRYLIDNGGITPVIAHIERFYAFNDKKVIKELLELPVIVQMNAEYVINEYHKAKRLIKKDVIHVLGSDCHRPNRRTQNMGDAVRILNKKIPSAVDKFSYNSELILKRNYKVEDLL